MSNRNNSFHKMNQTDYTPFNQKKNYKKNKNNHNHPSKIININHYHLPSSFQDVDKAHDMINKYSLDKPISTNDIHNRYTPLPRGCTPLPRYSPCDEIFNPISEHEQNTIHRVFKHDKNDESDIEDETSIIYTFNDSGPRNVQSPTDKNINMVRIIRGSPQLTTNLELSEIIAKTEHALRNKMTHNTEKDETKKDKLVEKPEDKLMEKPETFQEIIFTDEIKNVKDLISLSKKYSIESNTKYSINLQKLNNIVPYLIEFDEMIGMDDIKVGLTNQLMYFLQDFEYTHMLHTIIEGPPGVGKTCLGKILGKIYFELKCIKTDQQSKNIENEDVDMDKPINLLFSSLMNNREKAKTNNDTFKFKIAKRSDFVGQYVGHTAVKTQKLINECFGGVLFIDEAYSLGADDPFSKECINTLNQNLSENGDKFICIIAGYTDSLESNFFSYNSGLQRRFPFRYTINKYSGTELSLILKKKINKENYSIDSEFNKSLDKFIDNNKEYLPNYGGDIETLFFQMKMMHAKRVFGKSIKLRKIFDKDDIVNGFAELKKNQKKKEEKLDMYN